MDSAWRRLIMVIVKFPFDLGPFFWPELCFIVPQWVIVSTV